MKKCQKIIVAVSLPAAFACASSAPHSAHAPASADGAAQCTAQDPERADAGWFAQVAEEQSIDADEAQHFVDGVRDLLVRKIYNPHALKRALGDFYDRLSARVAAQSEWTTGSLVAAASQEMDSFDSTQLGLVGPQQGLEATRSESGNQEGDAISLERKGRVPVITVKSFAVPRITRANVVKVIKEIADEPLVLIDLRGNGGGGSSSVSYLAAPFLGPDAVLFRQRNRCGLTFGVPFIVRGWYEDAQNQDSKADARLLQERGYIEWRTGEPEVTFRGRVGLLVDHNCTSSCEVFAAAMRDHRRATVLGLPTEGRVLVGGVYRSPWRGFGVLAPVADIHSPNWERIEDRGVDPDWDLDGPCGADDAQTCLDAAVSAMESAPWS